MPLPAEREQAFQAIPVSPGVAIGRVHILRGKTEPECPPDVPLTSDAEISAELERFTAARAATRQELLALRDQVRNRLNSSEAEIFDTHLQLVDDRTLIKEVEQAITVEKHGAEFAFYKVVHRYVTIFSGMADEYLRERAADIRDVAGRIRSHLRNAEKNPERNLLQDRRIVVAAELTPSQTASFNRDRVLGFAVVTGSSTSHAAILARSMQIPAVTGIPPELMNSLSPDDTLIIDGFSGRLIVNPEPRTEEAYRLKANETGQFYSDLRREHMLTPETRDGFRVQLAGNLDEVNDVESLMAAGAGCVGLFRTEFFFLNSPEIPDEETQLALYRKLLIALDGRPVVVRTLDIGGDKSYSPVQPGAAPEANPFLGLRGIRLSLKDRRDLLRTQLRALLRAGVSGDLKVMLPMVSCLSEIEEVKSLIVDLQSELTREGLEHCSRLSLGVMIETPAAALQTDIWAGKVDFFSIGTNDLVQYTMAIDRSNERVAYLYQPSHPAILELIARTVRAARRHNIWVSVCGQMAADPQFTPLLVGMGIHELSMDPNAIGPVRRVIRGLSMHEAEQVAEAALLCEDAESALELSRALLRKVAPEVAILTI
ncbi:MAG: phosphoenolpyruvate--protein phosphotransferase [Lentisphaeria bacterium]|nr:phosphoenolpyruvate--protein phosphotransferase [Lentisphaeria bacterium]